ncbi:trans-aconitate methyltransferase [Filimonas zeae]|nr:class I SAM-dependent methyltransferase [Filimonas zeae]MDR6341647.1 trans-aconitate methyltransferase [Filimonas zeae]
MDLLTEEQLIWSPIVANNSMNRKRSASGVNSYEHEIGFKPEKYLDSRLERQECVKWLDLCCGEGNALLQYATGALKMGRQARVVLLGIDLVDYFQPLPPAISCLKFQTGSLVNWTSKEQYDLVICVHGLHYIGDKLKVL